jgi:flavodoxin
MPQNLIMKKSINIATLLAFAICLFSSCTQAQKASETMLQTVNDSKILIVYVSRTNNTKAVAEMIRENVGGDLIAIELVNPYPADYKTMVDQVARENESGFLPPLKTKIAHIEKYDTIFIGFPTWGMQLPPPMKSFLNQYDLSGKTVIPFNTNAGYGLGNSIETVKKLSSNSKVLEAFSVEGGKEKDGILFVMRGKKEVKVKNEVKTWLIKINLLKQQ